MSMSSLSNACGSSQSPGNTVERYNPSGSGDTSTSRPSCRLKPDDLIGLQSPDDVFEDSRPLIVGLLRTKVDGLRGPGDFNDQLGCTPDVFPLIPCLATALGQNPEHVLGLWLAQVVQLGRRITENFNTRRATLVQGQPRPDPRVRLAVLEAERAGHVDDSPDEFGACPAASPHSGHGTWPGRASDPQPAVAIRRDEIARSCSYNLLREPISLDKDTPLRRSPDRSLMTVAFRAFLDRTSFTSDNLYRVLRAR
jgi:hypothetical protein